MRVSGCGSGPRSTVGWFCSLRGLCECEPWLYVMLAWRLRWVCRALEAGEFRAQLRAPFAGGVAASALARHAARVYFAIFGLRAVARAHGGCSGRRDCARRPWGRGASDGQLGFAPASSRALVQPGGGLLTHPSSGHAHRLLRAARVADLTRLCILCTNCSRKNIRNVRICCSMKSFRRVCFARQWRLCIAGVWWPKVRPEVRGRTSVSVYADTPSLARCDSAHRDGI